MASRNADIYEYGFMNMGICDLQHLRNNGDFPSHEDRLRRIDEVTGETTKRSFFCCRLLVWLYKNTFDIQCLFALDQISS